MGVKSWEYYQQPETGAGIPYELWWLCGCATAWDYTLAQPLQLGNNVLIAVPFNQIRGVTVRKMGVHVAQAGDANGKWRLGIYNNNSDSNSKPSTLVLDAGEIDVSTAGVKLTTNLSQPTLDSDKRYWAVILTNANSSLASCIVLGINNMIHLGATLGTEIRPVTGLQLQNQTYGPLPANFPADDSSHLRNGMQPASALAFSAVT